jgi:broad specificity phosphatase PhoE
LLWDSGDSSNVSYGELVDCLRRRYAGADQGDRYLPELRALRRGPGETLHGVYQSVKRLMTMDFPAEKSRCVAVVAHDAFLTALANIEVERRVREREPMDVETAYTLVVKRESMDKIFERADDSGTRPTTTRRVRGGAEDDVLPETIR